MNKEIDYFKLISMIDDEEKLSNIEETINHEINKLHSLAIVLNKTRHIVQNQIFTIPHDDIETIVKLKNLEETIRAQIIKLHEEIKKFKDIKEMLLRKNDSNNFAFSIKNSKKIIKKNIK